MGFRKITLNLPAGYTEEELRRAAGKKLGIKNFSVSVVNKSLDARNRNRIHWVLRLPLPPVS